MESIIHQKLVLAWMLGWGDRGGRDDFWVFWLQDWMGAGGIHGGGGTLGKKHMVASDLAGLCCWDIGVEVACGQMRVCSLERRLELEM